MKHSPERPEIINSLLCCYESGTYGFYLEVDGASPTITNHLADVAYRVLDGSGVIATSHAAWGVESGDEVTILSCEPYAYAGRMCLLASGNPVLSREFVTYNGDKLSGVARQKMRRAYRATVKEQALSDAEEKLTAWLGPRDSHLAFLAGMHDR